MSEDMDVDEHLKAVRRARSRVKTIVCSFCMNQVDDACFSWYTGISICRACLAFATAEVAKAKKTTEVAEDLTKIATKLSGPATPDDIA